MVLHPPVKIDVKQIQPVESLGAKEFVLSVGRPRGYKKTELVARACEKLGVQLVAVGWTPEEARKYENVKPIQKASDAELHWLYTNALCLATASKEDFGLTPIEANAFGTPAVCPSEGGFLDTLLEGISGYFYPPGDVTQMADAIERLIRNPLDEKEIKRNADRFSNKSHETSLRNFLEQVWSLYR
jgi:glycosyltransferase involved in cell wall biosynthesis